jgi:hypothetical protein
MPVILAIQETEIRRIIVQSQSGQIVLQTLSRKYPIQKQGWGWLKCSSTKKNGDSTEIDEQNHHKENSQIQTN